jgi:hypothetical protein
VTCCFASTGTCNVTTGSVRTERRSARPRRSARSSRSAVRSRMRVSAPRQVVHRVRGAAATPCVVCRRAEQAELQRGSLAFAGGGTAHPPATLERGERTLEVEERAARRRHASVVHERMRVRAAARV